MKTRKTLYKRTQKIRAYKITQAHICHLTRQLATLISASIPLVQSLDIIAKGVDNLDFKRLILNIKTEIEKGRSFSESLRKFPRYFDDLLTHLIQAGEASGSLDIMLDRIATYKEKSETLKRKLKKVILYPIIVLVLALGVTMILLLWVVPQFEVLFKEWGAQLPGLTRSVISISNFLQQYWVILGASGLGLFYIFQHIKKTSKNFQYFLDKLILNIPFLGTIIYKAAIARYARTLSTTFSAGVPLIEALESVAGVAGNKVYTQAILHIRHEVTTGSAMQTAMKNTSLFPNKVIQMIAIGEESGTLEVMLTKVASIYEEEVDIAVESLSHLVEPFIMILLGVIVGTLVLALYLPIFKMGSIL